jgi:hypothetical protein
MKSLLFSINILHPDRSRLAAKSEFQFESIYQRTSLAGANPEVYSEYASGTTSIFSTCYSFLFTSTASGVPMYRMGLKNMHLIFSRVRL